MNRWDKEWKRMAQWERAQAWQTKFNPRKQRVETDSSKLHSVARVCENTHTCTRALTHTHWWLQLIKCNNNHFKNVNILSTMIHDDNCSTEETKPWASPVWGSSGLHVMIRRNKPKQRNKGTYVFSQTLWELNQEGFECVIFKASGLTAKPYLRKERTIGWFFLFILKLRHLIFLQDFKKKITVNLIFVHVCLMWVWGHVWRSEDNLWSWFFPSTFTWNLETEFRSQFYWANVFICWAILLT